MSNLESNGGEFQTESLERLRQRVRHARAMLRTVMIAIKAMEDGSVSFANTNYDARAQRWSPVTAAAQEELIAVRDTCINSTLDTPAGNLDWVTPLTQIEALDAALWHSACMQSSDRLENFEVFDAAEVIVGSLDELLKQAWPSAIPQVGQAAAVPA